MCRAINAYHHRPIAYVKFLAALFEKLFGHERSPPSGDGGDGRRRTSQSRALLCQELVNVTQIDISISDLRET
jgi:hypothetical protein